MSDKTTTKQTFVVVLSLILGRFILNQRQVQLGRPEGFSCWPTTVDSWVRWVVSVEF
jgi:hypothetical protein